MSVNNALSVGDIVNVQENISPTAAAQRNFGSLLIMGDSGIINPLDRYRLYSSAAGVATDFGASAPETLAANIYFGATPQPAQVYVGAWARTPAHGSLLGQVLGVLQQVLTNFTGIANGAMQISVDGTPHALAAMNFTAQTNLNGVAAVVQTALAGAATCIWDAANSQFVIKSATTGATSAVSFATAPGSGTDVSTLLGLTAAAGAESANGIAAESFAAACAVMTALTSAWYGIMCAASVPPTDADYIAAAAVVAGSTVSRIMGITTQEGGALVSSSTTDLAALLEQRRAFIIYSSSSPYACAACFGDEFTIDFNGSNTTNTLMFKQANGVIAETLSETQAAVLKAKNCNVFVNYNNGTAIIQNGVMSDGTFFDIVHGADWLINDIQTNVFNTLFGTPKIPQTDQGVDVLLCTVSNSLDQAVENGYVAPGVWTGPPFGSIVTGQTLPKGYYVFAPAIASQSSADRAARKSPTITVGIKLAGAIHTANIVLNVNQ